MCFDADARPPLPPIAGSAVDADDLQLTSADGSPFAAYAARAGAPSGVGVVVIPDVRGLHTYYEELVLRLAEAGADAVAVDMYARTAGPQKRSEGFDFEPHVRSLRSKDAAADVGAAVAYLRSTAGGDGQRIFTLGFCIGGRISFLQAGEGYQLAGVIGFYGWPVGEHRSGLPAPAASAPRFGCPVLALYGGDDQGIPTEAVDEFDRALAEAGVPHESIVYGGAPHSFFDKRQEEYASQSADAWERVLEFMGIRPREEAAA